MNNSTDLMRKYSDLIAEAEVPVQPAAAPGTPPVDNKLATGAQTIGKKLGSKSSGAMTAKGLGQIAQGKGISSTMTSAIAPFVEPLSKILADPMLKQKFMNLINQVK